MSIPDLHVTLEPKRQSADTKWVLAELTKARVPSYIETLVKETFERLNFQIAAGHELARYLQGRINAQTEQIAALIGEAQRRDNAEFADVGKAAGADAGEVAP